MNQKNMAIANTFYTAFGEKNIEVMEKYLDPDVQLITPLSELQGKEAYLEAVKGFMAFFKALTIRATFGKGDQAIVVYDLECGGDIGKTSGVALMTFQEGLITRNELFHDTSPYAKIMDKLSA
ncbi:MAG: nuclear transport factor 2 family protein [Alphaproteobacteria bacterium]|nr:nuclear transport factor 2 family protein [Alphaproteobacteria bacterium]